jgi:hypothetical protein
MSLLESAIGWISPESALRRARARAALGHVRAYEGARNTRRTKGWIANSSSANSELGGALTALRNRSRDLVRNNPYASRALDTLVSNAVGTGIRARWPKPARQLWIDWAEDPRECDYYGELDFYGLEALAARTVHESGECLIRRRQVRASANETVPVRCRYSSRITWTAPRWARWATATTHLWRGARLHWAARGLLAVAEHPGDVLLPYTRRSFQVRARARRGRRAPLRETPAWPVRGRCAWRGAHQAARSR